MTGIKRFIKRFTGLTYGPYPEYHGDKAKSHIHAQWSHWEDPYHNSYDRGHLPQIRILASGWKARLLALFFLPKAEKWWD